MPCVISLKPLYMSVFSRIVVMKILTTMAFHETTISLLDLLKKMYWRAVCSIVHSFLW